MFKFKTFILTIIIIILLSSNLYADTFFPVYIKPGNSFTNTLDLDYINEYTTGNGIYIQNVRIWGHANASGGSFIVGDNSYLTILPVTTNYSYYIGDDIIPSTNDYNNLLGGQAAGQNWSVTKTYGANNGLGYRVFYNLRYGFNNTGVGHRAGEAIVDGVNNICIGSLSGPTADSSNQLYIDIAKTDTPLIHGNFSTDIVTMNGKLYADNRCSLVETNTLTANTTLSGTDFCKTHVISMTGSAVFTVLTTIVDSGKSMRFLDLVPVDDVELRPSGAVSIAGGSTYTWTASGVKNSVCKTIQCMYFNNQGVLVLE